MIDRANSPGLWRQPRQASDWARNLGERAGAILLASLSRRAPLLQGSVAALGMEKSSVHLNVTPPL
jgi:hypothetical protein